MKQLNVTPEEFIHISEMTRLLAEGRVSDVDFVAGMRRYGCEPYTHYHVVVRRDVAHIGWHTLGVPRIEAKP